MPRMSAADCCRRATPYCIFILLPAMVLVAELTSECSFHQSAPRTDAVGAMCADRRYTSCPGNPSCGRPCDEMLVSVLPCCRAMGAPVDWLGAMYRVSHTIYTKYTLLAGHAAHLGVSSGCCSVEGLFGRLPPLLWRVIQLTDLLSQHAVHALLPPFNTVDRPL